MECEFEGTVWEWRGPSPYHFVTVPREYADVVRQLATAVTYGWGMVPVEPSMLNGIAYSCVQGRQDCLPERLLACTK